MVVRRLILCAALLAAASPALAQEPAPKGLVPPLVEHHHEAIYPAAELAAKRHAEVVLIVTIDNAGHVTAVDVGESGGKPFDDAAISAMREWTFTPAKRDGKPVASRIRVPFHFAPPQAPPSDEVLTPGIQGKVEAPREEKREEKKPETAPPTQDVRVVGKPNPPSRGTSDFRIPRVTLGAAPHASAADLLSTAPGFYVAHPEGEAIAQRIYLRGFDAEHGQDVEFKVSGIPLNQPSHIHGQGYADLNVIIPEVVRSLRVVEGVYDPHQGDFSVAGSVDYDLGVEERRSRVKLGYGSFSTKRLTAIFAPAGQSEETFGAATFRQTDGFGNGTRGAVSGGFLGQYKLALPNDVSLLFHAAGYGARSNLAGVLRRDDIDTGRIGFYDAYPDPTARAQSAGTSRTQLSITLEQSKSDGSRISAGLWVYLANFRSRTNFTGYIERSRVNPEWVGRGDLIEQANSDLGLGGSLSYRGPRLTLFPWLHAQYELGAEVRTHGIEQAQNLLKAPQNETWDQRDDARVRMTDVGLYMDGLLAHSKYVRLRGGARADLLFFDIDDKLGNYIPAFASKNHIVGFRRTANGIAFGPRLTLEGNPLPWIRLSASYGEGYRSPQARQLEEGEQAPFAKVKSYELGATIRDGDRAALTVSAYQTDLSYDLAFDPQEGRLERIGPTTRRGLAGYFLSSPTDWMNLALSATFVRATLDSPPIATPENPSPPYVSGQSLPYVPPLVLRSDLGVRGSLGMLGGKKVEWRAGYGTTFLSSRPLPYSQTSTPIFLLDALASVRRDWLEFGLEAMNLLDLRYADTEYAFVSNWQTGMSGSRLPARHITAAAPRTILFSVTVYL